MDAIMSLLFNNEILDSELETFCTNDPKFLQARQQFEETAEEIAKYVGSDLYDAFERSFNTYLFRTADLYYLYGLGLRQEVLRTIGAGG